MIDFIPYIVKYLPWFLSAMTVYSIHLAGKKDKFGWKIGIYLQALWIIWILASKNYGFLPLNACMWWVQCSNYLKWKKEDKEKEEVDKYIEKEWRL